MIDEPLQVLTPHLKPGIYQAPDGYKYRVFSDGSAYRLIKRVKQKGRVVTVPGDYGDAMVRVGRAQPKIVVPSAVTQSAAVPSVPDERTAGGAAP